MGSASASFCENLLDLAVRHLLVRSHHEGAAVGKGREGRRAARQQLEAVAVQLELANDLRTQQAVDVRGGRDLVARPDLFGDAGAADQLAPLEHHALARARQIGRGHERVVPGADEDDVVAVRHFVYNEMGRDCAPGERGKIDTGGPFR